MSIADMDGPATPQDTTTPPADATAAAAAGTAVGVAAPKIETPAPAVPPEEGPTKCGGSPANDVVEEEADEEDNLFNAIEEQQRQSDGAHRNDAQPHEAAAAPTLLRKAIAEGKVGVDDSEAESEEGKKKAGGDAAAGGKATGGEEKKEEAEGEGDGGKGGGAHVHARVSGGLGSRVAHGSKLLFFPPSATISTWPRWDHLAP